MRAYMFEKRKIYIESSFLEIFFHRTISFVTSSPAPHFENRRIFLHELDLEVKKINLWSKYHVI